MIINLIRYVKGYVEFTATGQFTERFLNLAVRSGIHLWNYNGTKDMLRACTFVKEYKLLKPLAKKANIKMRHHKKFGLPFLLHKNRNRSGLAIGAVIGLVIMFVLSGFIWSIEIDGTNRLSTTFVQTALEKGGLFVGAYKANINVKRLEREITLNLKDVGWLTVNITGSNSKVSISESMKLEEKENTKDPCNLKSTESGQIVKLKVTQGQNCVNLGDGVMKNQLLVSGIVKPEDGKATLVHSGGQVIAEIVKEKNITVPINKKVALPTGNSVKRTAAKVMGVFIPTSIVAVPNSNYICQNEREHLYINNVCLPIEKKTETWQEFTMQTFDLTKEELKEIANTELLLYEAFNEQNTNILERKIKETVNNNNYMLTVVYTYQKNIAKPVKIGIAY